MNAFILGAVGFAAALLLFSGGFASGWFVSGKVAARGDPALTGQTVSEPLTDEQRIEIQKQRKTYEDSLAMLNSMMGYSADVAYGLSKDKDVVRGFDG